VLTDAIKLAGDCKVRVVAAAPRLDENVIAQQATAITTGAGNVKKYFGATASASAMKLTAFKIASHTIVTRSTAGEILSANKSPDARATTIIAILNQRHPLSLIVQSARAGRLRIVDARRNRIKATPTANGKAWSAKSKCSCREKKKNAPPPMGAKLPTSQAIASPEPYKGTATTASVSPKPEVRGSSAELILRW
jgi:hypothetical protein